MSVAECFIWASFRGIGVIAPALLGFFHSQSAFAQFSPITNDNYALEIYNGVALGSGRVVGMGGTAVATAQGSATTLYNPASPAVRSANSNDTWDWDFHADWLTPSLSRDIDNNGIRTTTAGALPYVTFGLVVQYKSWGFSIGVNTLNYDIAAITPNQNTATTISLNTGNLTIARNFFNEQLIIGLGPRGISTEVQDSTQNVLYKLNGTGIETGVIYRPNDRDYRLGTTLRLPLLGSRQNDANTSLCVDETNCFPLPRRTRSPWSLTLGAAYRFWKAPWNKKVTTRWLDESYLLVNAEIVLTGSAQDTHGVEAFTQGLLQPTGRDVGVSMRAGSEYEWIPGRLRIRGGSYWEPSRFWDAAGQPISGRLHATAGFDVSIWNFTLFGRAQRLRISATGDIAKQYANTGLSVGFWN